MAQETAGLKLDIQAPAQSIKDLKAEIKAVNSEMLKVKEGSAAYQSLAQRAGEAKEKIKDLREATNLFTRGGTVAEIARVGQTIAGGFAAASGAAALLGGNVEDIQKQMLKVQASIAIVEGIKSAIAGWESVQRLLNLAMAANPIAMIIAGVVALTGAIAAFLSTSKDDTVEWKEKAKAIADSEKALHDYGKEADALDAKAKIRAGKSNEEYEKIKALEKEKKEKLLEIDKKYAEEVEEILKETGERNEAFTAEATKAGERAAKEQLAVKELYHKKEKEVLDAKLEADSKAADAIVAKIIADEKEKTDKAIAAAYKHKEIMDEIKFVPQINQEEVNKFWEDYNLGIVEPAKLMSDAEIIALKNKEDEKAATLAEGLENYKKNKDEEVAIDQAVQDAKIGIAQSGANALGSLAALAEQGSDASKALALTQIAVSTAIGYVQALDIAQKGARASGPLAPYAFPVFYASQIAAVLSVAAKAKSILGSGGGAPSAPSLGNTSSPRPPQVSNAFQGITNIETDQNGNYNGKMQTQMVKAYVVESELTSTQKNIASIIKKSKIE